MVCAFRMNAVDFGRLADADEAQRMPAAARKVQNGEGEEVLARFDVPRGSVAA